MIENLHSLVKKGDDETIELVKTIIPRTFKADATNVKYKLGGVLASCERGASIVDFHTVEFKEFSGETFSEVCEYEISFINKLIKFACGCLNRRCDGTIYFGVADDRQGKHIHGEIVGMKFVTQCQVNLFQEWIEKHICKGRAASRFRTLKRKPGSSDMAKAFSMCVGPVRAIPIEGSKNLVLEIDIEAMSHICESHQFYYSNFDNEIETCMREGTETITTKDLEKWQLDIEKNSLLRQNMESNRVLNGTNMKDKLTKLICQTGLGIDYESYQYNLICNRPKLEQGKIYTKFILLLFLSLLLLSFIKYI